MLRESGITKKHNCRIFTGAEGREGKRASCSERNPLLWGPNRYVEVLKGLFRNSSVGNGSSFGKRNQ